MRQKLFLAMLAFAIPANAEPVADVAATRTTAKAAEPFAQCFAAAQERASLPWWFVPKAGGGGTFSNAGANGVREPYFLDLADRGTTRLIRLSSAPGDGSVLRAVDGCL